MAHGHAKEGGLEMLVILDLGVSFAIIVVDRGDPEVLPDLGPSEDNS